ncbi:MAG: aspartate aminotransferase family protein [Rhodospirillales bacterium]|jgi:adenosylmethionine-8-amino-7-oxononanoate aminotransferase|nr:aspartate aminotransferase family protein [Rhodospirillales bacterium]
MSLDISKYSGNSGPAGSVQPPHGGPQDVMQGRNPDMPIPMPMMVRAEGIHMWDEQGNEYIDLSSGPIVSNIGHGVKSVGEAIANQINTLDFAYSRVARHQPNIDFSAQVTRLAGPGFERVCFSSGGTEAIETAIKFLRQYTIAKGQPMRKHVISCMPSYHGGTFSALSWSGDTELGDFLDGMVVPTHKVPAPFTYRQPENYTAESYAQHCADALRDKIKELGEQNVLAFMIEPIGGVATGCNVPPDSYIHKVRKICNESGVYLVFDEVMSGAGRSGKFMAAHYWPDALPDVSVMAKGLGSGYAPVGATLFSAKMSDWLANQRGFDFTHTYTANPVICAAGKAVLDYTEANDLMSNAARMGEYLCEQLNTLKETQPLIGNVRGRGLLMSVELVANQEVKTSLPGESKAADRVRIHGMNNGLMIYSRRTNGGMFGDWLIVAPPLSVTQNECDEIIKRLSATLKDLNNDLVKLGLLVN